VLSVVIDRAADRWDGPPPPGGVPEELVTLSIARTLVTREADARRAQAVATRLKADYARLRRDRTVFGLPSALHPMLAGRGRKPCHYYLYVPGDYRPDRKYPLVVMLHGGGGNFKIGLFQLVQEVRRRAMIVACPTFGNGNWWTAEGAAFVREVIGDVRKRYNIDGDAVAIGGVSNGAIGAWAISRRYAGTFAGVISVSGSFNGASPVRTSKGPPLFIAHGARDGVIPAAASRAAYAALKGRAGTVYREFPDAGHLVALTRPREVVGGALDWFEGILRRRGPAR
jgi:predicted esterase